MKKALAMGVGVGLWGLMAFGQACAPCIAATAEPPCYTTFWQGEDICFELVVPWGLFCCCWCTSGQVQVLGWRVITLEANVVYQATFPTPVAPSKWVWNGVDASGNPVPPGYYKIVVSTTAGEFENTVKIAAKQDCCSCFFPFFFLGCWGMGSKPCAVSWCQPYVKLYRCPVCPTPCAAPCGCGVTIFLGIGDP